MIPLGSPLAQITSPKTLDQLTSEQIRELQKALRNKGYTIAVDGILGNETRRVYRQFKESRKLTHLDLIGATTIHWLYQMDGTEDVNEEEEPLKITEIFRTPFSQSQVNWTDFSSPVSRYFLVGEVCRYSNERLVMNHNHRTNVLNLAHNLDRIRQEWGCAITVTSWYRPPTVNARVGGARYSQHLNGGAVDITPVNGKRLEFERFLDRNWFGALGYGQRNGRGFTHLDIRNGKGWRAGGTKAVRWNY